jgi:hypothetical protein
MTMLSAPSCVEIDAISLLESPWQFVQMLALATSRLYHASHNHIGLVHAKMEALGRECRKLRDLE